MLVSRCNRFDVSNLDEIQLALSADLNFEFLTILYRTCFSLKFAFLCVSISDFDDSNLSIDLNSLNKSMKFQIEYFMILVYTTESYAFQFFEKFNLNFRFVFVIVLNERM